MEVRQQKARQIVAAGKITRGPDHFVVPSQNGSARYRVVPDGLFPSCTCLDFELTGLPCKHLIAVREWVDENRDTPDDVPTAPVPRKTYKQAWVHYNRAQTTEKERFQVLLRDLCAGLAHPPHKGKGRPRVPLADSVFCAALKVYLTFSGRRAMTDIRDAVEKGYIASAPHFNSVLGCLDDESLTPILRALIAESAKPLAAVEVDFAADSSAFTSNKFARWYDAKYGKERTFHVWRKVQMMCGVKTNIVTCAVICDQDGPDSPYLPQLTEETAANFTVSEVSADKGYSSVYGHDAVAGVGGTPFIAFKKTATGGSGGLWERMYHYFAFRRAEFLAHYHKRSNSESVFSSVKRKFGDAIRAKSPTAQANELLMKFLCHNLCVLVQEMNELGIDPVFWKEPEPEPEDSAEPRTVLRFDPLHKKSDNCTSNHQ